MNKDEMKNKYSAFITEMSEILGLEKPVDILKLCTTTDLFFRPLEKRIEELEKENTDLKEEINKIAFARGNLEAENAELKLKLEALEGQTPWKDIKDKSELIKENAELKADNDARKFAMAMSEKVEKQLREEIAELKEKLNFSTQYYQGEKAKEQLTKAKEIIKNLIDYPKRFGQASGKYHHECELAEQFLNSEVEK